jgi:hypothetical protein
MTVDAGLSGEGLKDFLISLQGLKPSEVGFYTIPVVARPGDRANVIWVEQDAKKMWTAMIKDTAYPPKSNATATTTPTPSTSAAKTANPTVTTGTAADTTCIS